MATAEEVLNISRSHIGEPPNRFWDWYPAPAGTAWCCIYQSYVLTEAGIDTHFAWVSGLFDSLRNAGNYTSTNPRDAQPGDLIAFEWGSTAGGYDHIAMCESVDGDGITAINGNWGGKVTRAWHSFNGGGIAEVARPSYSNTPVPGPTPGPISTKEGSMFHLKNIDGRDEFIALTDGGQVVGSWSTKPGGVLSPWAELKGGIAGSNLVAEVAPDGRLCATLAATGELWGSWQSAPGQGPWVDWFKINDLRRFLGG